jgi:hypothetical protein
MYKNKGREVNGIPVQSCFLKVKIEDTGIGMTEDEQVRIFTRFSLAYIIEQKMRGKWIFLEVKNWTREDQQIRILPIFANFFTLIIEPRDFLFQDFFV